MDRIFHVRTTYTQIAFLLLLGVLSFYFLWIQSGILAAVVMVFLIIVIERIIKSTYTITKEGKLIIYKGRFSKDIVIPIADIKEIEKCRSVNFGTFHLVEYLLIKYGSNKHITLMPIKEKDFLNELAKY
ncbi:MAG: PH domain-containing protein [Bacteroides sp.]|nr:PH domain-containing protein [Bacteroides sp.]MDD2645459.1 PH domain-containing protein [Bacteroides sp.]MDD4055425.1 PH domain-containing protein [Bacteroides sp.]MDD4720070.1 PH domain-containing protein [Bacteroides sp.]NLI63439.1 PH domain-containing protein [Bacteroidales bacterium]